MSSGSTVANDPVFAELLLGPAGSFTTGSDLLADGGATASFFYGPLGGDAPTPGQ